MKNYASLSDTLSELKGKGYKDDFDIDTGCLYCGDLDMRLDPGDFHVDETYQFKGDVDPEHPLLYAISTSSGAKGLVMDKHDIMAGKKTTLKQFQSLVDALADLGRRGYKADFEIEPTCLYCSELNLRLQPEEFKVTEVYRFEENSSPEDNSVLYAIESSDGVKGTLVDAYGTYAENMSFEMAQKLGMGRTGSQVQHDHAEGK